MRALPDLSPAAAGLLVHAADARNFCAKANATDSSASSFASGLGSARQSLEASAMSVEQSTLSLCSANSPSWTSRVYQQKTKPFVERLLEPLLSVRAAAAVGNGCLDYLAAPGAPPRRPLQLRGLASTGPSAVSELGADSLWRGSLIQCPGPRHRSVASCETARHKSLASTAESDKFSNTTEGQFFLGRKLPLELAGCRLKQPKEPKFSRQLCREARSRRLKAPRHASLRASASSVTASSASEATIAAPTEAPSERTGYFRDVSAWKEERKELGRHLLDCQRREAEVARGRARKWRQNQEHELQIWELRWYLTLSGRLDHGPGKEAIADGKVSGIGHRDLVPSPIHFGEGKSALMPEGEGVEDVVRRLRHSTQTSTGSQGVVARRRQSMQAARLKKLKTNIKMRMRKGIDVKGDPAASEEMRRVFIACGCKLSPKHGFNVDLQARSPSFSDDDDDGLELIEDDSLLAEIGEDRTLIAAEEFVEGLEANPRHGASAGHLNHGLILSALRELGLTWRSYKERKAVRDIIWNLNSLEVSGRDFITKVIQEVQQSFAEERRPRYEALFSELEVRGEKCARIEVVFDALRRMGVFPSKELAKELASSLVGARIVAGAKGKRRRLLNRVGFLTFTARVREAVERDEALAFRNVVERYGLGSQEQETFKYDLVFFYRMFHEYDPIGGKFGSQSGRLGGQEVTRVIRMCGCMPRMEKELAVYRAALQGFLENDRKIGFLQFLQIMEVLRGFQREHIRKVFDLRIGKLDTLVSKKEVSAMLADCHICPSSQDEWDEVESVFVEIDPGDGRISFNEFVVLCQRISIFLRLMQRDRERQYVLATSWSEQKFVELHTDFQTIDEDCSETVEKDELMQAMELLSGKYLQTVENLNLMLEALDIDVDTNFKVNFLTFLKLFALLEQNESRRQLGLMMGLTRERSDHLYSVFKGIDRSSADSGFIRKPYLEKALAVAARRVRGQPVEECRNLLVGEPQQVDFSLFIRIAKTLELLSEGESEEALQDMREWRTIVLSDSVKSSFEGRMQKLASWTMLTETEGAEEHAEADLRSDFGDSDELDESDAF